MVRGGPGRRTSPQGKNLLDNGHRQDAGRTGSPTTWPRPSAVPRRAWPYLAPQPSSTPHRRRPP
eukprot:3671131-Alexandrium_andersonii.AAC.1